jgi:hypothetical protein
MALDARVVRRLAWWENAFAHHRSPVGVGEFARRLFLFSDGVRA